MNSCYEVLFQLLQENFKVRECRETFGTRFFSAFTPRLPDTDNIKRKNKNNETILSRFFPEQKTERSSVLRHVCPIHEVLTLFFLYPNRR